MPAKLVAEEGTLKGLVLSLEDGDQWVIGRDPDACQLLVEDPAASRKHLICRTTPKGILVENLSETNPIQVNDEEVKEPRLLHDGDAVKIGSGTFRFHADGANLPIEDTSKQPPVQPPVSAVQGEVVDLDLDSIDDDTAEKILDEIHDEEKIHRNETELEKSPPKADVIPGDEKLPVDENVQEEQTAIQAPIMEPAPTEKTDMETSSNTSSAPSPLPANETPPESNSPQNQESHTEPGVLQESRHDSIYEEDPSDRHALAEINFGLLDTGRWLLKVISGPNNGAEFSMQTGNSYIIGTDPNACDIVFHDTSVSRQHARITVSQEDTLSVEDLKSRNGTLVDGQPLKGKQPLSANTLVALGTTSFIVFDREGEMQTIISPLMPSIVKVLQSEESKRTDSSPGAALAQSAEGASADQSAGTPEAHRATSIGAFILIGILTGLFAVIGIGTSTLFRSEPVASEKTIDPNEALERALAPFPSVKHSFNPNTGQLLLVGHVLTTTDKSQLLYALQGLNFIKSLDDSGVIIDEYVWREINQVLEKNPDWKAINVMSTSPGHFVVSGYLQTRSQADRLNEYLNANFLYPDLLEKKIIVDQEILSSINAILQGKGFKAITPKLDNGEVVLTGGIPIGKVDDITAAISEIKEIRGVRNVRNQTTGMAPDQSIINISDKYEVTGISNQAGIMSVVINGRILMKGDALDGMTITLIQNSMISLEKDGTKYKIDFNR